MARLNRDVCAEQLRTCGNRCTHNFGILGVCLCAKHYSKEKFETGVEQWTEEENQTVTRNSLPLLGELLPFLGELE